MNSTERATCNLDIAYDLAAAGVPVVCGRLTADGNPDGRNDARWADWQHKMPGPRTRVAIRSWRPGEALAMVAGHVYDVIDIDPRNGGLESFHKLATALGDNKPAVYLKVQTPSGGQHLYIEPLGIGTLHGFLPGIDLQGGLPDGSSRGLVFIPPTVRRAKGTRRGLPMRPYMSRYELQPLNGHRSGAALKRLILEYADTDAAVTSRAASTASELKMKVRSAEAGQQRMALLRYVHELERRGLEPDEIVTLCMALRIQNYDERRPWREKDFQGLLHREGAVIADATQDEMAVLSGGIVPIRADKYEAFWTSRSELKTIRQCAQARMIGPQALLGSVLARVLAEMPPNVVLPNIVGAKGTLNSLFALTGASGEGKTSAETAADELLIVERLSGAEPPKRVNVGSGQGITGVFGQNVKDKESGAYELRRTAYSAVFSIGEIESMGAQASQAGSVLLPTLREAWSGQGLGGAYSDVTKNRHIPAHSYRMCVVAQVQGELSSLILSQAASGFAGRWVWFTTDDPPVDVSEPEPLYWQVPDLGQDFDPEGDQVVLDVCELARQEIRAHKRNRRERGVRGEQLDPLDAHTMYTREKVAAALALLHMNTEVTEEDWRLSGLVMDMSTETRKKAEAAQARADRAADSAQGSRAGAKAAYAERTRREMDAAERYEEITERIAEMAPGGGEVTHSKLRNKYKAGDKRDQFDADVAAMVRNGSLIVRVGVYHNQEGKWYSLLKDAVAKRGARRRGN